MAGLKYLPHGHRLLSGKLLADLSETATTAVVNNPPAASKLPTYIEIDYGTDNAEVVRVIGVSGNTITIERGINTGGVGIAHSQNALYKEKITSTAWNKVVDAIESGYLTEDPSYTFAQVSSSSFKITAPGVDRTGMYTPGRTVRLNGSTIVHVVSSSYSNPDTIVTVRENTVPASITSVEIAIGPKNDFFDAKAQHNEDGTHKIIQGLDNNQAITQKDSGGTERSIAKVNSSDILEIGDSNLAGQQFNTPLVNNTAIKQKDSGGTARNILNLNSSNDLEIGGDGISSYRLNNSIIKPATDSASAIRITKADGTTTILNINSDNNFVGIGLTNPSGRLGVLGSVWDFGLDTGVSPEIGRLWYKSDGTGYGFSIGRKAASDNSYSSFVYIRDGGNVGIGITTPGYRLDVNGACHASSFPTSSDKRFKENVKEIDNALEKVKKIRGVYFNWNKFYRETLKVDETEDTEIGVIAQEVKEVIPEVITTFEREVDGKKERYFSVEYARLSALLINAIKELAEKVENLEKKYEQLNKSRA